VDHQQIPPRVMDSEILLQVPVNQFIAVRRLEYLRQGILAPWAVTAERHGQEVHVVVAQGDQGVITQGADQAQGFQGAGPAVDDVTDEPEAVAVRAEADAVQQGPEAIVAAVDVSNGVIAHSSLPVCSCS